MSKKMRYNLAAALSLTVSLVFLLLFVITLLPVGVEGVRIEEPVRVSSSAIDAEGTRYLVQIRGRLINENDREVHADAIPVQISGKAGGTRVTLEGCTLPVRLPTDIFYEWESETPYTYVDALYLTLDGKDVRIENIEESVIGADTVLTLAVALIAAFLAMGFIKQRYYIYQEEKMSSRA